MNKIFLKKSFAGYPVWEYQDMWEYYIMWIKPQLEDGKLYRIHKDIVELMKDHFEEVKERPTSWEELWVIKWYFIEMDSDIEKTDGIFHTDEDNKNIFLTKQQAEASIALAQITQLLDKYDIPEESRKWYTIDNCVYDSYDYTRKKWLLRFDTKEKKDHFYKHHADLISKLAPFYIF